MSRDQIQDSYSMLLTKNYISPLDFIQDTIFIDTFYIVLNNIKGNFINHYSNVYGETTQYGQA